MSASRRPPEIAESSFRQLRRLVDEPFELFADAVRDHGNVFVMHVTGQAPWVMLGEPEAVRTVFRASADEIHNDADGIKYLVGQHTVLFLNGEAHRRERRILTPPFKHERMVVYADRMLARTDDAIDRLSEGQVIDAFQLVQDVALQVIVECVFGVEAPERRARLSSLFSQHLAVMQTGPMALASMAMGGERLRGLLRMGTELRRSKARLDGPIPTSRNPLARFFDTKAELDAMLKDELERCRREGEGRDDVLALLVRARYDDGAPMSDGSLHDELFALLVGGHETSAITLSWALHFLLTHPAALAKAKAELEEHFGDGPITPRGVERLRYIPAAIDEKMRLRPVATSVPRKLAVPMRMAGYDFPVGTRTMPAPAILHFREDLWPNAQAFEPERFLGDRPSPFHYLPWGGGSRACLGRPFAQVELRIVLAELLRRVDFRLVDASTTKPVLRGMLVGPSDGVPLVVEKVRPRGGKRREKAGLGAQSLEKST